MFYAKLLSGYFSVHKPGISLLEKGSAIGSKIFPWINNDKLFLQSLAFLNSSLYFVGEHLEYYLDSSDNDLFYESTICMFSGICE